MTERRLSLGLDLSTQSLSAVAVDVATHESVASFSLDYLAEPRLAGLGLEAGYLLPPREPGEADQPPALFLAALDALFQDLREAVDVAETAIINVSAQQHGHVYLGEEGASAFQSLDTWGAETSDLATLLGPAFAYDRAPVWMTADTGKEAASIREAAGGREALIERSGSDAQLRFTGPVVRHIALAFPDVYRRTRTIQLLNGLVAGVLTADPRVPADDGNACGTSLMNYRGRQWDETLLAAVAGGLPGGAEGLREKLPDLVRPDAVAGNVCAYFVNKYGLRPECLVAAGSGDNPQSKVLVAGDLLSLGSSLVVMAATDGTTPDPTGASAAMYDGLGRPFAFGCRTNGALVWDEVRTRYGLARDDYRAAEEALQQTKPGAGLVLWQPRPESFPASGSYDIHHGEGTGAGLAADYAGVVESSLAAVYRHSRGFSLPGNRPLYVTGGPAASPGIMRRVAAIWGRPVVPLGGTGAALGAAAAGIVAYNTHEEQSYSIDEITADLVKAGEPVTPTQEDVAAFHAPGGYLERFATAEDALIRDHPAA
jgi:xylulokinase